VDLHLQGKRALVGGASKGLGLASVAALTSEGCHVVMVSRSRDHLDKALASMAWPDRASAVVADLSTAAGIETCIRQVDRLGAIDILVNNIGGPPPGGSFAHDDTAWSQACESLLLSVKRLCDHYVPLMRARKWGRVLAITSRTVKEPAPHLVLSNVFRTAVTAYLKVLAAEVAADGITVNTVLPGAFRTERYEQLLDDAARRTSRDRELVAQDVIKQIPQGRFQRPEELGALVAFLASEQASGITGAAIPVDGGALKGLLS